MKHICTLHSMKMLLKEYGFRGREQMTRKGTKYIKVTNKNDNKLLAVISQRAAESGNWSVCHSFGEYVSFVPIMTKRVHFSKEI